MSLAAWALVVGAALVAAGAVVAMTGRCRAAFAVQGAGVAALAAGAIAVFAGSEAVGGAFRSSVAPAFGLDALSAFFLIVLCVVALPALAYARDALAPGPATAALAALTGGFILAMAGLVAARDIATFLACWELMTLLPAAAILVARQDAEVRRSVLVYLGVTHVAGAGVWVALLILAGHGAIGGAPLGPGALQSFVVVAALIGFLTKAGIAPLHVWLPRAHPVAPSHISALMSGVMIMLALYGLIRVLFTWLTGLPQWVGITLVVLGMASALVGVLYALVQRELKRLLAFSSIEHAGVVVLMLGAVLLLGSAGQPQWEAIAFAGALLHILNHAAFKGALFLGAGAIQSSAGTLQVDRLGGLLRRMPWTGGAIGVAALAIAGLPLLNGFASEWIGLQALLRLPLQETGGLALVGGFAAATLAASAGLAALCFVGVAGLALLGRARSPQADQAHEPPRGVRGAVVFLAGLCVALALATGLLIPRLSQLGPGAWPGHASLTLAAPGTGTLPPVALALALILVAVALARARGSRRAAPAPVWVTGQRDTPALGWTLAGFTKPLRLIADVLLRAQRETTTTEHAGIVERVHFRGDVPHLFDTHAFEPGVRAAGRLARQARRVQSGSLRAYLVYFLSLLIVLLALVRLEVFG